MNMWELFFGWAGWLAILISFWQWQARRVKRQNERIKSILLGVSWLINKTSEKPDDYVTERLKDALREED